MVKEQIGSANDVFLPFIYALFFFILIGNLIGNVPYSFAIGTKCCNVNWPTAEHTERSGSLCQIERGWCARPYSLAGGLWAWETGPSYLINVRKETFFAG
ncbi:BQ2448_412 [Microbotryum intermedium]|uniref:BQ2448_412 protein n=1 Tax=Microbotryum intermedium TaxID=269621 RepID=A0A238F874_9BASI|nr:BQ2448_412 [Microbotryum intermedium]